MIDLLPSADTAAILLAIALAWWSLRRLILKRFDADAVEVDFNAALEAVRMNMAHEEASRPFTPPAPSDCPGFAKAFLSLSDSPKVDAAGGSHSVSPTIPGGH